MPIKRANGSSRIIQAIKDSARWFRSPRDLHHKRGFGGLLVLGIAVMFVMSGTSFSEGVPQNATTPVPLNTWLQSADGYLPILLGAFIVGMVGSASYYAALRLGYTGADQRDWFLKNFGGPRGVAAFIFIGGTVATVFQLPELQGFVPIQGFVLGITWPFIVSQYVSNVKAPRPKEIEDLMGGSST